MLCFLCRRVLKNRAEVPKPLLLEEKELVHSTDGKKISVHSSKGLAIGEITVLKQLTLITFIAVHQTARPVTFITVHQTARPDHLHYIL